MTITGRRPPFVFLWLVFGATSITFCTDSMEVTEIALRKPCGYNWSWRGDTFSIVVRADGAARFQSEELGPHTGQIHRHVFSQMANEVVEMGFFELEDMYTRAPMDSVVTCVTATAGEKRKEIEIYGDDGPKLLRDLVRRIESLRTEIAWEGH